MAKTYQHFKGPFTIQVSDVYPHELRLFQSGVECPVATTSPWAHSSEARGVQAVWGGVGFRKEERKIAKEANLSAAHDFALRATAPTLLEALATVVDCLKNQRIAEAQWVANGALESHQATVRDVEAALGLDSSGGEG